MVKNYVKNLFSLPKNSAKNAFLAILRLSHFQINLISHFMLFMSTDLTF